jgi:hypothetical protein
MKQQQRAGSSVIPSEDPSALEKKHLWRMRWVMLIAFLLMFVGSLVVIVLTDNPILVSLPGSLLLFMRPMMRYLYPQETSRKRRLEDES